MFYRVTTTIHSFGVRIDANGDFLPPPIRTQTLNDLGLPDTPPIVRGINSDGSYVISRDFDTRQEAMDWADHYDSVESFISYTITEVEQKEIGTYSDAYLALTAEQKISLWENTAPKISSDASI